MIVATISWSVVSLNVRTSTRSKESRPHRKNGAVMLYRRLVCGAARRDRHDVAPLNRWNITLSAFLRLQNTWHWSLTHTYRLGWLGIRARSPEPNGRRDVESWEQFRVGILEQHRDCFVYRACIVHSSARFGGRPYTDYSPSPHCDVTTPQTTFFVPISRPEKKRDPNTSPQ